MSIVYRPNSVSRGSSNERRLTGFSAARLVVAALAVTGVAQVALGQVDPVLYREVFPNNAGGDRNLNSPSIGDSGWRLLTGTQGQDFTAFQSLVNGGKGAATNSALGGPGGVPPPPGTVAEPVNSNPTNPELTRGFVMNTFSGGGWNAQQLYYTTEYTIDRTAFDVTRVAWTQASLAGSGTSTNSPDPTRVALRVGTSWFVSEQTFTAAREPFAMEFWSLESQALNMAGAQWLPLTLSLGETMAVGTVAQPLPATGNITGMGLWWDKMSQRGGFDAFTIRGKAASVVASWAASGGGDWSNGANWSGGNSPNSAGATADFGSTITGPSTVNVDSAITVGAINFNSPDNSYRLDGAGSLTLSGGTSKITVTSGQHEIAVPLTLPSTATIDVAASGSLSVRHLRGGDVTVQNGPVKVLAGADNSGKVTGLTLGSGASLDLNGSSLIVDYSTTSPYATVLADAQVAKIIDSAATSNKALAVVDNADLNLSVLGTQSTDASAVLVVSALKGDTNLNNAVDFDDLLVLAQNYGSESGAKWTLGDSTFDGAVNFDDLLALAQNYGSSAILTAEFSPAFAADWALARSLVPEPASMLAVVIPAVSLASRRRASRRSNG